MDKKHFIEFNSNYMKYQRNTIRKLEKQRNICILFSVFIVLALITSTIIFVNKSLNDSVRMVYLQDEIKFLKQKVDEKDKLLFEYSTKIGEYEEEMKIIEEKYVDKLQSSLKILSGKTIDKMVAVTYLEAGNQGEKGMQLVADTIYNRAMSDKFKENTVFDIIKYPKQFSVLNKLDKITLKEKNSENYKTAENIVWDKILHGKTESEDVLFFMNPEISNPASRGWMEKRKKVIEHKNHVFYE